MNHISYIDRLRSNLCYVLTVQKENKEAIKKLVETIESIEAVHRRERHPDTGLIMDELFMSINLCEELNSVYDKEISRLITIILEKTQTEI